MNREAVLEEAIRRTTSFVSRQDISGYARVFGPTVTERIYNLIIPAIRAEFRSLMREGA
jgi:hypothetical protein